MHFGSPSNFLDPYSKAKLSYVHYIIRGGEAELCVLELTSLFHHFPSISPKHLYPSMVNFEITVQCM